MPPRTCRARGQSAGAPLCCGRSYHLPLVWVASDQRLQRDWTSSAASRDWSVGRKIPIDLAADRSRRSRVTPPLSLLLAQYERVQRQRRAPARRGVDQVEETRPNVRHPRVRVANRTVESIEGQAQYDILAIEHNSSDDLLVLQASNARTSRCFSTNRPLESLADISCVHLRCLRATRSVCRGITLGSDCARAVLTRVADAGAAASATSDVSCDARHFNNSTSRRSPLWAAVSGPMPTAAVRRCRPAMSQSMH
jgi:hypothetical protein